MNIHEFAKQLLELPEDTVMVYSEKGKEPFTTRVEKFSVCKTGGSHLEPQLQEAIKRSLPSTFIFLNVD